MLIKTSNRHGIPQNFDQKRQELEVMYRPTLL